MASPALRPKAGDAIDYLGGSTLTAGNPSVPLENLGDIATCAVLQA